MRDRIVWKDDVWEERLGRGMVRETLEKRFVHPVEFRGVPQSRAFVAAGRDRLAAGREKERTTLIHLNTTVYLLKRTRERR